MASITMTCPSGGNVLVHGGAASGAAGTICVCGTYTAGPALIRFLLAFFRAIGHFLRRLFGLQPPPPPPVVTIWVRVVAGGAVASPLLPPIAGDQSTSPNGQSWCVQNMPVPTGTLTGGQLTAYAWLAPASNPPDCTSPFTAGGVGAVDCCSGCGTAAGLFFVGELTAHPPLEVAVPDGPNAGRHKATAVAHRTWVVVIRGVTYRLAGDDGAGLVLRGPSCAESSTSVERGPFSATFPGVVLGSAGEVVVTQV